MNPPTEIEFKKGDRAPLLVVGAEKDNTVPASLAKKNFGKYEDSPARTDFIEFAGRPHLMMVAEGWREIAAAIEQWIDGVISASPARTESAARVAPAYWKYELERESAEALTRALHTRTRRVFEAARPRPTLTSMDRATHLLVDIGEQTTDAIGGVDKARRRPLTNAMGETSGLRDTLCSDVRVWS